MHFQLKFCVFSLAFLFLAQYVPLSHSSLKTWIMGVAQTAITGVTAVVEPILAESILSTDVRRVGFLLYPNHKGDPDYKEVIEFGDLKRLKKSSYNSSLPLIMIVHGFLGSTKNPIFDTIKDAYHEVDFPANIMGCDWSALSTAESLVPQAFYGTAAHNVVRVGRRLADFLIFLKKSKVIKSSSDIHLVGFSLGGHVSGMAGHYYHESTGEKIDRISGLDPAGPEFFGRPLDQRLDQSDAVFIDVTHTNRGIFGYDGDLGNIDFYPNGGGPTEIDCGIDPSGMCSHSDAYKYWAHGLTETIYACRCDPRKEVIKTCMQNCKDPIIYGEHVPRDSRGQYTFEIDLTAENSKRKK